MNRLKTLFLSSMALGLSIPIAAMADQDCKTVTAGDTWVVPATTRLNCLHLEKGANMVAPSGYSLTLTVDSIETGQVLTTTAGVTSEFVPGFYWGDVVLTVAQNNIIDFSAGPGAPQVFPFRQALYLDASGIVTDKSVPAAIIGEMPNPFFIKDILIASTGQVFDGIYAAGGTQSVENAEILLDGNGRSDFVGDGAAIVASGTTTKLTLDHVHIATHGVVRTGIAATGGSNVTVKNSTIYTRSAPLPADYVQTVNLAQMRSIPWMLGINGNDDVRATNLLGPSSKASYINSSITSQSWGALSTDSGSNCTLTAINSHVSTVGEGYGSYAIGNATEYFLGDDFDVGSYASINTGGDIHYGDSRREAVAALNRKLGIGLSGIELAELRARPTTIHSRRFGVMWHSSSGTVEVTGGTLIDTVETAFLDKSAQAVAISIDGSQGARVRPQNGIIMQVMDDDDPGPQGPNVINDGVYVEPTAAPVRDATFDVTSSVNAAAAVFSNISVRGNFYNSSGWTLMPSNGPGPGPGGAAGKQNMALTFDNSSIVGVISASEAHHHVPTIDAAQYAQLGEVTNSPHAAINNGVIVTLNAGSTWTVTGTSYLTKLVLAQGARIEALNGKTVSMTVDGKPTLIAAGNVYTGAIELRE